MGEPTRSKILSLQHAQVSWKQIASNGVSIQSAKVSKKHLQVQDKVEKGDRWDGVSWMDLGMLTFAG